MRFFAYLIAFLCALTLLVSGVFSWGCMVNGYVWMGVFVAALALACFTAILGSAVYRGSDE